MPCKYVLPKGAKVYVTSGSPDKIRRATQLEVKFRSTSIWLFLSNRPSPWLTLRYYTKNTRLQIWSIPSSYSMVYCVEANATQEATKMFLLMWNTMTQTRWMARVYHVRHGPFTERIKTRHHLSHRRDGRLTSYTVCAHFYYISSFNFVILGFILLKHIKILFLFDLTTHFQSTSKSAVLRYTNNSNKTNDTSSTDEASYFQLSSRHFYLNGGYGSFHTCRIIDVWGMHHQ